MIWPSFRPMIVYSCIFHPTILSRSLAIIFSQREGSSHIVSVKAHSLSNSQPWAIVVQFWRKKGRSLNLSLLILNPEEKCKEKSWRKMWYSLPSRLLQASLARSVHGAVRVWVGRFSTKQNPASRNNLLSPPWWCLTLCSNLGVPFWSTKGSARSSWCLGTSACSQLKI